jgi:uncharacterized protein YgiB involved in biofilm formation
MKAVVLLIIAGIAGLMAYFAFIGECPGGAVVRSEEQCRGDAGISSGLCRTIFARANEVARNANSVYQDPTECSIQFGSCLPHATIVGGYVPAPAGFCVKTNGTALTAMEPVYRRAAAR